MPSEIDGSALRALVEKATPGPFDHRDGLVRAIRGEMAVPLFEARPVYDPSVKAPTVRFPDGEVIFRAGSHDARHSFAEHQCRKNGEALAAILNALPALLDERAASEQHRNDLADKIQDQLTDIGALKARIAKQDDERAADKALLSETTRERDALREALTPSGDTKAAYIGEFHMGITLRHRGQEDYRRVLIEWTTIKEIMAAISARAARSALGGEGAE